VRATEVGGQLAAIKVHKGDHVLAGDVVAELSPLELTASVAQARAALAAAVASRDNVYAGLRAEELGRRLASDSARAAASWFRASSRLCCDAESSRARRWNTRKWNSPGRPPLVRLYATLGRMRILSSPKGLECAERIERNIVDTYLAPDKSFLDLREMTNNGSVDLLGEFSVASRVEFDSLRAKQL
jgi:hypothetical protein